MPFFAGALAIGLAVTPLGSLSAAFGGAFAGQVLTAIATYLFFDQDVGSNRGPVILLTNGVGLGIAVGTAAALTTGRLPARGLRWSPLGLVGGLVTGTVIGGVICFQVGHAWGVLVGIVGIVGGSYAGGVALEVATADLTKPITPAAVLARDRAAFRAGGLIPGIAIAACCGRSGPSTSSATPSCRAGWPPATPAERQRRRERR